MPMLELFHGADSQKMQFNIQRHGLTTDNTGKLYFAERQWTNCLVHGVDLQKRQSFVVKVRANIPNPPAAKIDRSPRAGNPDALIVTALPNLLIPCEFLEMYVRSGNRDEGFQIAKIPGPQIEAYLQGQSA
jgi:hypothetical protein